MVEPAPFDAADALGKHARPRNLEAVGVGAERREQLDVLMPPPVALAGVLARVSALDRAGAADEDVPDRLALAVGVHGAFDLVGGRGGAEEKLGRKASGERGGIHVGGR